MFRPRQGRTRKPISIEKNRLRILSLESLEARQMLSASHGVSQVTGATNIGPSFPAAIAFDATSGTLTLTGDNGVNNATVTIDTHNDLDPTNDEIVAQISNAGQTFTQR